EHVDGKPTIAFANARGCPKGKDDQGGEKDMVCRVGVDVAGDATQHGDNYGHGYDKDDLLVEGNRGETERHHYRAEHYPAAQDAPVGGTAFACFRVREQSPGNGDQWHD